MSRTIGIILAALVVLATAFYIYSSQTDQSEPRTNHENPAEAIEASDEGQSSDSTEVPVESIPFDEQWVNYIIGDWEWKDEGKELIFEFKANLNFAYYEKEYVDDPAASEDTASGTWEIIEADNFISSVKLVSSNRNQTEIVFHLEYIDGANMAARTDDMPEDVYVLFTRLE